MSEFGARPLFHTLVVMGAALAGCGGKVGSEPTTSSGGSEPGARSGGAMNVGGDAGTGGSRPGTSGTGAGGALQFASVSDCEAPSQWKCDNYDLARACRCEADAPRSAQDCETPFDFTCDRTRELNGTVYGVGCRCQADALVPTDCEYAEQFSCGSYQPYFEQCLCNPNAPVNEGECTGCNSFFCWNTEPRYGCTCQPCIR